MPPSRRRWRAKTSILRRTCARSPPRTGRRRRPAGRSALSAPARQAESAHRGRATLALHLMAAVVLELLHYARAGDRRVGLSPVLGRQAELVLGEELVEQLAAERAERVE